MTPPGGAPPHPRPLPCASGVSYPRLPRRDCVGSRGWLQVGVGRGAGACLRRSLTRPGTPDQSRCRSAVPPPLRVVLGVKPQLQGWHASVLPRDQPSRSASCCWNIGARAVPALKPPSPTAPPRPAWGSPPQTLGGRHSPGCPHRHPLPSSLPFLLRLCVCTWFAGGAPVPTLDWGPSSASAGVPGAVPPQLPAGLHTGSAGGTWLRAGMGASGGCHPHSPRPPQVSLQSWGGGSSGGLPRGHGAGGW